MRVLSGFDSGALPTHDFTADGIRFDLRPGQVILNVLVRDVPERLHVDLLVDEKGERFLLAEHNVVTFRVEVTTAGLGLDGFRETGRRFLANLAHITEWRNTFGVTP